MSKKNKKRRARAARNKRDSEKRNRRSKKLPSAHRPKEVKPAPKPLEVSTSLPFLNNNRAATEAAIKALSEM